MTTEAVEQGKAPSQVSPVAQIPASVFKDEGRDVSAEALERNELGKLNAINEPAAPTVQQTQPVEVVPEPPKKEVIPEVAVPSVPKGLTKEEFDAALDAEAPELINGKYKTLREQVKAYSESQKGFTSKVEAEVQKRLDTAVAEKLKEKDAQVDAASKTAEVAVAQKPLNSMSDDELLDLQVKSPKEYIRLQQQETLRSIRASQVQEEWRRDNKDILDMKIDDPANGEITGEELISNMIFSLAQKHPEILADGTGETALRAATGRFRNFLSTLRNQGKQEALVVRETVTPMQASTATPSKAPDNQTTAPAKNVDPVDAEVERLREEQRRISGRPQVRM